MKPEFLEIKFWVGNKHTTRIHSILRVTEGVINIEYDIEVVKEQLRHGGHAIKCVCIHELDEDFNQLSSMRYE